MAAPSRGYRERVVGRRAPRAFDVALAAVGLVVSAIAVWADPNPIGTTVDGPWWLRVVYPVLLGVPLAWRRNAPLGCLLVVLGGVVLQALVSDNSPEGFELMYCVGIAMFSAAAYADATRSVVALAAGMVAYGVYAATNADIATGKASELWAGAFFAVALVADWLAGVFVRSRRLTRAAAERDVEREEQVRKAIQDERARLARELHDVVSHNLSVVVVQAAGARAAGDVDAETLEKIERSGRQSLVEMRRLLGVLRDDGSEPALEPQPGIAELPTLAESLRTTGVQVALHVRGDRDGLSPVLELSIFRIVQEGLTNVLKHANATSVDVAVDLGPEIVSITVADDGRGAPGTGAPGTTGHGLVGVRERVALFGGELRAGARPDEGFTLHARLRRTGARS